MRGRWYVARSGRIKCAAVDWQRGGARARPETEALPRRLRGASFRRTRRKWPACQAACCYGIVHFTYLQQAVISLSAGVNARPSQPRRRMTQREGEEAIMFNDDSRKKDVKTPAIVQEIWHDGEFIKWDDARVHV